MSRRRAAGTVVLVFLLLVCCVLTLRTSVAGGAPSTSDTVPVMAAARVDQTEIERRLALAPFA